MPEHKTEDKADKEIVRARERGLESLSDAELVALLLQVKESVAARILERHGGLAGFGRRDLASLAFAERELVRVAASSELARRVGLAARRETRMAHAASVAAWGDFLGALEHEELWVCALDAKNALREARRVAMGGLSGVHVAIRDPLRAVLRAGANAFVLVHNHPSGDPTPSVDDVRFTERVAHVADLVGTPLLDHVVIARGAHTSMLEAGLFPQPNKAS